MRGTPASLSHSPQFHAGPCHVSCFPPWPRAGQGFLVSITEAACPVARGMCPAKGDPSAAPHRVGHPHTLRGTPHTEEGTSHTEEGTTLLKGTPHTERDPPCPTPRAQAPPAPHRLSPSSGLPAGAIWEVLGGRCQPPQSAWHIPPRGAASALPQPSASSLVREPSPATAEFPSPLPSPTSTTLQGCFRPLSSSAILRGRWVEWCGVCALFCFTSLTKKG